jgi:hypothetical protein
METRMLISALAMALGVATTAYAIPPRPVTLATVHIPRTVMADDQPLAPGTYQVRLLGSSLEATPGETAGLEQWVEFLQRGHVKGKAVASVVPQDEIAQVAAADRIPAAGQARVDVLRGDDYVRIWVNRGGTSYLIHLPTTS